MPQHVFSTHVAMVIGWHVLLIVVYVCSVVYGNVGYVSVRYGYVSSNSCYTIMSSKTTMAAVKAQSELLQQPQHHSIQAVLRLLKMTMKALNRTVKKLKKAL